METEPETTGDRVELPTDFAEHVATVSGLDAPAATLAEWWTALLDQFSELDRGVAPADLYGEEPTRRGPSERPRPVRVLRDGRPRGGGDRTAGHRPGALGRPRVRNPGAVHGRG